MNKPTSKFTLVVCDKNWKRVYQTDFHASIFGIEHMLVADQILFEAGYNKVDYHIDIVKRYDR